MSLVRIEGYTLLEGALEVATQVLERERFTGENRTQIGAARFMNSDLVQALMTSTDESPRLFRQRLQSSLSLLSPHYSSKVSTLFAQPEGPYQLLTTLYKIIERES